MIKSQIFSPSLMERSMDGGDAPKGDASPSVFRRVDSFVRGVANGMTFGLADYIAGVGDTAIKGGSVGENIKKEVAETQQRMMESPAEVIGGEVVGAAVDGVTAGVKVVEGGIAGVGRVARNYRELSAVVENPAASFTHKFEAGMALGSVQTEINAALATGAATGGGAVLGSTVATTVVGDVVVDRSPHAHDLSPSPASPPRVKGPSAGR
jgi:hypothetical protein